VGESSGQITRTRVFLALIPCVDNVYVKSKKCAERNKQRSMNSITTILMPETRVVNRFVHPCVSAAKPRKVNGDEGERLRRGHKPLSPGDHRVPNGYGLWSGAPFGPHSMSKEMIGGSPTRRVPSSIFHPWCRMTVVNFSNSPPTS